MLSKVMLLMGKSFTTNRLAYFNHNLRCGSISNLSEKAIPFKSPTKTGSVDKTLQLTGLVIQPH
jgi:hypothetical protein